MYKIEITADTLSELAGKAMSLAAKLNTGTATEAAPKLAVAEAAPENPTEPAPTAEAPSQTSSSEPDTPTAEPAPSPSEEPLNFDTDVAPIVLQVVKEKGKPVAQDILSQFGVEKASMLDASRWPELIAALQDAL